jgi:hypothetical protein
VPKYGLRRPSISEAWTLVLNHGFGLVWTDAYWAEGGVAHGIVVDGKPFGAGIALVQVNPSDLNGESVCVMDPTNNP